MRQALDRAKSRPLGAALAAGGLASMSMVAVGLAGSAQAAEPREVNKNLNKGVCADAGLEGDIILRGGPKSNSNDLAEGTIYNKGTPNHDLLDVTLLDESLEITGVAIRGGSQYGANRWWVWEGEPFTGMTAPDNPGDDRPIVKWFVCATEKETTPPPTTPAKTVTAPPKTVTAPPKTVTQAPPAAKPPVALPTAVPAGVEGSGSDGSEPWAAAGLLAGLAMTGAGAWVLSRKQG